ncbi:MAG TPA: putative LPS assembly protein LptD [Chlorobaculum sp.]|nr:putative LPS assembly protein LptD [Chlorobaculum sp.]
MRSVKSLKVLILILLVNMAEGIVSVQAGDGGSKGPAKKSGPAQPDSLKPKRDDLDSTVVYTARDSLVYSLGQRTVDLYGKARVDYKDMRLEGPKISVEQRITTIHSRAALDSLGRLSELPVYTDKTGSFNAELMTYNYKTRKGKSTNVSSSSAQGIYSGSEVERTPTGVLYITDGTYTTCDLEDPHYWFSGKHMTIIPGDRLTSRPFVMYIHPELFSHRLPVIPILPLPFMSIPISNKRASGFLFPRIGSNSDTGTYLSNLGYFWAINDYSDLRVESDIASNGSWRFAERFRYRNGNHYSGSIEGEYETFKINNADPGTPDRYKNRDIRILHHQEFDPTSKLDINLQYLGGDRYYNANSINPESIITEQATSYASFSKSWDEGNRVLIAGYQRVDNLINNDLTQTFTTSLYQNRIYPFRPRLGASQTDWSSRLSIQPTVSFSGLFTNNSGIRTDYYTGNAGIDLGFQQDFAPGYRAMLTQGFDFQGLHKTVDQQSDLNAYRVQLPLKVQSTLFRYLNLNPSLTVSHYRVNSTVMKYYSGGVQTATVDQPADYTTAIFSVDAQTRLYGVLNTGMLENLIGLKAIRHTFIPTLTFSYNPDYTGTGYNYYGSYYDPVKMSMVRYNRFEQSLYSLVPEKQRFVGISLQNLFHGKFRGDDVSVAGSDKTVQLLSFTAATGYNFAADSLRIAPLVLTASSNAFSPGLMMTAGATYDFYAYDPVTGYRIDKLNSAEGKGLLRLVNGFLNMSVSFTGNLRSSYEPTERKEGGSSLVRNVNTPVEQAIYKERFTSDELVKFSSLLPWSLRMSLYLVNDRTDPLNPTTTALLNSAAKVSLSKDWQVGLNSGFDLRKSEFIYPALLVYRDLHDFQFSCQWVPSGQYRGYLIQIAMKPPQLRDLKFKASSGYGQSLAQ